MNSEIESVYNTLGLLASDPAADKIIIEVCCHPMMVTRFREAAGWATSQGLEMIDSGIRIIPVAGLAPGAFLTKFASGRVAVGSLPTDPPNRHARRTQQAQARKLQKARK